MQNRFDWGGVAAAGVSGGVMKSLKLPTDFGGRLTSGMAGGVAGAAAASLVTGRNFGDTLIASLPSIIGNTVGEMLGEAIAGNGAMSERRLAGMLEKNGMTAGEAQRAAKDIVALQKTPGLEDMLAWGGGGDQAMIDKAIALRHKVEALEGDSSALRKLKHDFTIALASLDSYYGKQVPGLLNPAMNRVESGPLLQGLNLNDKNSSYYGVLYHNSETGDYIYANRGTNLDGWGDVATNGPLNRAQDNKGMLASTVSKAGMSSGPVGAVATAVLGRLIDNMPAVRANRVVLPNAASNPHGIVSTLDAMTRLMSGTR